MSPILASAATALILGAIALVAALWEQVVADVKKRFRHTGVHRCYRGAKSTLQQLGITVPHTGGMHRQPPRWAMA